MSAKARAKPNSSRNSPRRDSLGIDELLDDAEFCASKTNVGKAALANRNSLEDCTFEHDRLNGGHSSMKAPNSRRKLSLTTESAIDAILDDAKDFSGLLDPRTGDARSSFKSLTRPSSSSETPPIGTTRRCHEPTLAGTYYSRGLSSLSQKRACSNLRCTSCDFHVSQFNDVEWIEPVEYLFLRTHMPNLQRLKEKMRTRKGTTAYGCQCSSFSAVEPVCVTGTKLKWVCAKH